MEGQGYIAEPAIATALFLSTEMGKPLLVEGDAGVGKTEIAKVLARLLGRPLIRLQCYEGLDVQTALYEWDYPRQMLRLRMAGESGMDPEAAEHVIFSRKYLLERPLLQAITAKDGPAVLLIDEIDRADDGFEAFLLEVLSDFQVTIPELGTIRAEHRPHVILTSNRTREIGDALRRRCLYLYIEHPSFEKEVRIIRTRVPGASEKLSAEIGRFLQALRGRRLLKAPGVAETIDWAQALVRLHRDGLDAETVEQTLGCLLKDRNDILELPAPELAGPRRRRARRSGFDRMTAVDLVAHVAAFAGALRERGVRTGLSDEADAVAALTLVDLADREEVRLALKTALKIRRRDAGTFEELFARLWGRDDPAARERAARARASGLQPLRKNFGGLPASAVREVEREASDGSDRTRPATARRRCSAGSPSTNAPSGISRRWNG